MDELTAKAILTSVSAFGAALVICLILLTALTRLFISRITAPAKFLHPPKLASTAVFFQKIFVLRLFFAF
jgi:hypothetical protein